MAQVNLGSIKFKWKGTYNGATSYTADDVVEYNGSSYICILASTGNLPTNATYFEQMSQAGTNGTDGTDLGTTLTTQGDIVYRDASGLARLPAGTAGEALITNGTGANPSWGSVAGGKVLQVVQSDNNSYNQSTGSTSLIDIESASGVVWETAITPSATSSKILIMPVLMLYVQRSGSPDARQQISMEAKIGTGSYSEIYYYYEFGGYDYGGSGLILNSVVNPIQLYEPNTTSEVKIKFKMGTGSGGDIGTGWGGRSPQAISRCILWEIGA